MTETRFSLLLTEMGRYRKRILSSVLLVTLLAGMGLFFVPFESSLFVMLPQQGKVQRMIRVLQEARFTDKIIVSLEQVDVSLKQEDFLLQVDQFSGSLSSPRLTRLNTDFSTPKTIEDFYFFLKHMAHILGADDLEKIEASLKSDAVEETLRERYMEILKPGGAFLAPMIRRDPLGLQDILIQKIEALSSSFGYDVVAEKGHLVSRNGRHAMLIFETDVPMTDTAGSTELLRYLESEIASLPATVKATLICGHTHSVSNQHVIKKDIRVTIAIASLSFLLLFLFYFRDAGAVWIFLVPVASVLVSLNITAMVMGRLSSLMIGLGSVVAGIAVDYGIHVYVALRSTNKGPVVVTQVAKPVCLGALTTVSVFVAFFFSTIEGYRQLACFSTISILISLGYALFLIPLLVSGSSQKALLICREAVPRSRRWMDVALVIVFVALTAVATVLATRVPFSTQLAELDGTESCILADEAAFRATWGNGESDRGLLVVAATNEQRAEALNQNIYERMRTASPTMGLVNVACIWPSREARAENVSRWKAFWNPDRMAGLRFLLTEKGGSLGFSDNAFDLFFQNIRSGTDPVSKPTDNHVFDRLTERFIRQSGEAVQYISYFPDTPATLSRVRNACSGYDEALVISRKELGDTLSLTVSKEVLRISGFAATLILLVTFLLLKSVRMSLVALIPAVTGLLWLLAVMALLGLSLNIANMIAGIVVIGLCIDYGIFMVYAQRHGLKTGTATAVTLSAVTTVVGAGVLLFARHPALFSIGLTLVVGVLSGYLAAILWVPALYTLCWKNRPD